MHTTQQTICTHSDALNKKPHRDVVHKVAKLTTGVRGETTAVILTRRQLSVPARNLLQMRKDIRENIQNVRDFQVPLSTTLKPFQRPVGTPLKR